MSSIEAMFVRKPATLTDRAKAAGRAISQLYMTAGVLCLPYFLWQSAREYDFWIWAFEMMPLQWFKVFVWPYFLFF
jgi:hypothetical protein